jgi:hypothetical protein
MSRTSSESSLEEQSTVSSKSSKSTSRSSHRKSSLDAMITADRNRIGNQSTAAKDPDRGGDDDDDEEDMPSLSSFRQEDMSYRTLDDNMSLPSLSSIRIDDLSMSSSYHSHHMNESGSGEGWGSFTSGGVSGEDGEESSEFSASSSHSPKSYTNPPPPPPPGGASGSSRGDVMVGVRVGSTLNMPTRSTSPLPLPPRSSSPIAMPKRSRSPLGAPLGGGASTAPAAVAVSCISRTIGIQTSSGSPPRATRVTIAATTEPDGSGSLPLKPARSTSPPRRNDTSEKTYVRDVGSADDDENNSSDSSDQGRKPVPAAAAAPGPVSILKKNPIERSGSFPLPIRSASVIVPEQDNSSSSSLRGVDSLPRLPRRTSTMEEDTALATAVDVENAGNDIDRRRRKPTVQPPAPLAPTTKSSCTEETTSATEVEEGDDGDKEQKKQGTLTKIVKKIGKASSFRTSSFKGGMKMIGKTASKLKLKAASRNGETSSNNNINSTSSMNNPSHYSNNNQSITTSKTNAPESQDKAHKTCRSKDR